MVPPNVHPQSGARRTLHAALAFIWLFAPVLGGAANPTREHRLKAAAFFNIIAFTEWPATAFASEDSPLVVGMLGQGDVPALLEEFLAHETWRGRQISLRRLASPIEARTCHVVYVAEQRRWGTLSRQIAGLPVLTVSDAENFAHQGGMIQFAMQRKKLRLVVNLRATRDCGLTISSKVLRFADVIHASDP
jgi:hypothetical protein